MAGENSWRILYSSTTLIALVAAICGTLYAGFIAEFLGVSTRPTIAAVEYSEDLKIYFVLSRADAILDEVNELILSVDRLAISNTNGALEQHAGAAAVDAVRTPLFSAQAFGVEVFDVASKRSLLIIKEAAQDQIYTEIDRSTNCKTELQLVDVANTPKGAELTASKDAVLFALQISTLDGASAGCSILTDRKFAGG